MIMNRVPNTTPTAKPEKKKNIGVKGMATTSR
jgi:hypothetical protein